MSEPSTRREEPEDEALSQPSESPASELPRLSDLVLQGDVEGILSLARARRTGDGAPRDLSAALACYRAAGELGSHEAMYAASLFLLSGGIVPQDLREGALLLRSAAEGGIVAACIYLANLYELGIHYAKSSDKADVWYRRAARGAGIVEAADSQAYAAAMAELGAVRHAIPMCEDPTISVEDQSRLLRKVKTMGYRLALQSEGLGSIPPPPDSTGSLSPLTAGPRSTPHPGPAIHRVREANLQFERSSQPDVTQGLRDLETSELGLKARPVPAPVSARRVRSSEGEKGRTFYAHLMALMFLSGGLLGGGIAHAMAVSHVAHGGALPVLEHRAWAVLPLCVQLAMAAMVLVYRPGIVLVAWIASLGVGSLAYVVHGYGAALPVDALWQGVLAGSLVFMLIGLIAGARTRSAPR